MNENCYLEGIEEEFDRLATSDTRECVIQRVFTAELHEVLGLIQKGLFKPLFIP